MKLKTKEYLREFGWDDDRRIYTANKPLDWSHRILSRNLRRNISEFDVEYSRYRWHRNAPCTRDSHSEFCGLPETKSPSIV